MRVGIAAAELVSEIDCVADAPEVPIAETDEADKPVLARIAGADGKAARALFDHVDFQHDRVRLGARIELHIDVFKESQVVHALHTAARFFRVERLARLHTHLASDNAILRLRVAFDRIAFQFALVDGDLQVAVATDIEVVDLDEDIAVLMVAIGDLLEVFMQRFRVQEFAFRHRNQGAQLFGLDDGVALDGHRTKHRIFQQMISDDDALGHDLKSREDIVEQAGSINSRPIFFNGVFCENVAGPRKKRFFRFRQSRRAGAVENDIHDGLPDQCLLACGNRLLVRTKLRPMFRRHRAARRRDGFRSFCCGSFFRRLARSFLGGALRGLFRTALLLSTTGFFLPRFALGLFCGLLLFRSTNLCVLFRLSGKRLFFRHHRRGNNRPRHRRDVGNRDNCLLRRLGRRLFRLRRSQRHRRETRRDCRRVR